MRRIVALSISVIGKWGPIGVLYTNLGIGEPGGVCEGELVGETNIGVARPECSS